MNCLFCKILNKEIPSYKVFENNDFYAFLDIFPKNKAHTLLIPKKCVKDFLEAEGELVKKAHEAVKDVNKILELKFKSEGLTIITNNKLGQEVKHLHWHLIPRFTKENYTLPETLEINVEETWKKLAE